jgi:hypothetical protein
MKRTILFFLLDLTRSISTWLAQQIGDDILQDALTDEELNEIWPLRADRWDPAECDVFNDPEIINGFRVELIEQWEGRK